VKSWLASLGFGRCPPFHRDVAFLAAVAAGAAFWIALALSAPPSGRLPAAATLVSLLVWQPAIEEALFRGVLQTELLATRWGATRLGPVSGANAAVSAAFAALHLLHHPPVWAAGVLVPSLMFGWLRERHGSVWPALALHIYYNSGYFLLFGA
jgi:uncharacterized protein